MKSCVFAGTFDPFSNGHLDVAVRAAKMFDSVIIAVSDSAEKKPMFPLADRAEMARLACADIKNVRVMTFAGLLVDFLRENKVNYLVRGLRTSIDFEYENTLFEVYKSQMPEIECAFFMAKGKHIQGAFIRELISFGGDFSSYVQKNVKKYIESKKI
jgi:pantetheine-phosphate adenylyltransferase